MISSITNYNRYRAARLPVGSIFEKKTTLYLQRHKRQKSPAVFHNKAEAWCQI